MNIEEIIVNEPEILKPSNMATTDAPAIKNSQLKNELEQLVRVKITNCRDLKHSVTFNTNDELTDGSLAFLLTKASSFVIKRSGAGLKVTFTRK